MRVSGRYVFSAQRDAVFAAICDPATLMAVIPGCDSVELVAPDEYRGRITLRLPGFVGAYVTTVRLVDKEPPAHAAMEGTVEGGPGSIRGLAEFDLSEGGRGTEIHYHGDAAIQGPLARLDSRFAASLATSLINQGLRALDHRLSSSSSNTAAGSARPAHTEASE